MRADSDAEWLSYAGKREGAGAGLRTQLASRFKPIWTAQPKMPKTPGGVVALPD